MLLFQALSWRLRRPGPSSRWFISCGRRSCRGNHFQSARKMQLWNKLSTQCLTKPRWHPVTSRYAPASILSHYSEVSKRRSQLKWRRLVSQSSWCFSFLEFPQYSTWDLDLVSRAALFVNKPMTPIYTSKTISMCRRNYHWQSIWSCLQVWCCWSRTAQVSLQMSAGPWSMSRWDPAPSEWMGWQVYRSLVGGWLSTWTAHSSWGSTFYLKGS